jgi:hypothetical protein
MGRGVSEIRGLEELRRYQTRRAPPPPAADRWMAERLLLDALGLGLEQTRVYLGTVLPEQAEFERWILATAGPPAPARIARYHAWLDGAPPPPATAVRLDAIAAATDVLAAADLAHWEREGYVILRGAISADEAAAAAAALWAHLGADPDAPASWYRPRDHGIMVQLFQHPALEPARRSARIHKAFAQLWGTADLWSTIDRLSFNPPETPGRPFPGPHLHWDVSLVPPIPFATQAILYLTDTAEDQGALTLVPGFHRRVAAWLAGLPEGADPRSRDLGGEARAIAAGAGDLIIWHQALPHGASPNRAARPRLAHYVNMYSPAQQRAAEWR